MIPYIFLILYLFFLRIFIFKNIVFKDYQKKRFIISAMIPITLISGLRDRSIGADSESYYGFYKYLNVGVGRAFPDERIERGFIYLNQFLGNFTDNPYWLFFLVATFLSASIGIFIYKNANDPFLAVLFFLTLGLFQFSLSGMRQTIAIGFILFAYELIKQKKILWFLIVILIASAFHKSVFLFLPAYFIAHRNISYKNFSVYALVFLSLFAISEFIFTQVAELFNYKYGVEETSSGFIFVFIMFIITFFSLFLKNNYLSSNKDNRMYTNINWISFMLWALRLVSRTTERVTFYYMPATYILLEKMIISIKTREIRIATYILVSILASVLFIYRISADSNLVPYRFLR